jgi:hypothetical protein
MKGEVMFSLEMKHIGKIEAVGTVQVFGYSAKRIDSTPRTISELLCGCSRRVCVGVLISAPLTTA